MAGTDRRGAPRTELEHQIRLRDQTYDEVATAFCHLAREMGEPATITSRHLRRLAAGERDGTHPGTRRVLRRLFDLPPETLLAPWVPPSDVTAQAVTSESELIAMAADRARRFTLSSVALPADALEQVHADVQHLSTAYPQRPLSDVLTDLVTTQDTLFTLLESRRRPADARQLYLLLGVVGGLLAKASHDLADPHAAQTQARAAWLAAEHADHDGLRAWIRGLQSLVAYWAGRHQDAIRHAQQGQEYAGGGHGTVSVWLPVSEARAWAAIGNTEQARLAITRAEERWGAVTGDELDELGGLGHFTRARHAYYAADALAWTNDADATHAYAVEAVDAYRDDTSPHWSFGDQAGSHADLAIARIGQGDLDGAIEAVSPVLDLPVPQRINGIVRSVRHVDEALRRAGLHDEPAVIDLRDRIDTFTRTPAAAALHR